MAIAFFKLSRKTVYFLSLSLFAALAAWLSWFIYQGSTTLYREAEKTITQLQTKREAVTGMMRSGRERSVVLLHMSIEEDAFERDELRFRLDKQAANFRVSKALFENQQLTALEKSVFNDVMVKVTENESIQAQVADLLLAEETAKAQELLFTRAIPNQNRVIVQFEKILKLIEENSRTEIGNLQELLKTNNVHTFQLALLVVGGSFIVFLIIHALSRRREKELQQLVAVRTCELERANIQNQSLVDNASEGIITIDARQNIVLFNPAAETLFGYAADEVLGQSLTMLLPEKHKDIHHHYVGDFSRDSTKQYRMMDQRPGIMGKRKDGTFFPAEISISKYELGSSMFFTAFVRDISKQREAEEEIRRLAMYDSLTGLQNRHHFEQRVQESINFHRRFPEQGFWLMLLDLDFFKQVNDTFGHPVGDSVLKFVAQLFKDSVREIDDVGRLGGDEFAMLLQGDMEREDAGAIAQKLIDTMSALMVVEGNQIRIGVSIGIAECPEGEIDLDLLFRQADQAMYEAKEAGRNTYRFYH